MSTRQITIEHLCCNTKVLPGDFFKSSIFGKSMINDHYPSAVRADSDLNIDYFRTIGFPSSFCDILEFGLPLLLGAHPPSRCVPNHASADMLENREFVESTLDKWEKLRILSYVVNQPLIVNPLSVVSNGVKKRLVFDARSSGLNHHIISPKFRLPKMEDIVQSLFSNDFMLKLDLANGFLQLPICEAERSYLGFRNPINGRFGVFNRLSFGLRSAPFLFATFTNAIKIAARMVLNIQTEVYIDDWFIANRSFESLSQDHSRFAEFLSNLGVAIQHEKTEGPAQCITYLGLLINSVKNEIRLPEVKRIKYFEGLQNLLETAHPTMALLAKAAGRLVHISSVHRDGAANIQPLWDVLYRERTQWTRASLERHGLTIDPELHACLNWWIQVLSEKDICRKLWCSPSGKLFLWSHSSASGMTVYAQTICTDASNVGWGASSGSFTCTGCWSNRQRRTSINWRELKTVSLAINSWHFIRDSPVLVLSDSSTVVAALRKRASHTQALQNLIKELSELEQKRNIEIVALHIPGAINDLPDRLSRGIAVTTASLLSFNRESAPDLIRNITNLHGLMWNEHKENASLFSRNEFLKIKPQLSLIAVTTPDLPFLKRQLHQLAQSAFPIFLLIPSIPTSEYPLPGTSVVEEISSIQCLNAPNVQWKLLEVTLNGGTSVRIATNL